MTDDPNVEVAEAKIERAEELGVEIDELMMQVEKKIDQMKRLEHEAEGLLDE